MSLITVGVGRYTIEKTENEDEILSVLSSPEVKRWIGDDFTREKFHEYNPEYLYLKVVFSGKNVGIFALVPRGSIEYEGHTAFLKEAWGNTLEPTLEAINWIFTNTRCEKITGRTPADNKKAIAYNIRAGFMIEGLNRKSVYRNGKLIDQVYFGMERSRWF